MKNLKEEIFKISRKYCEKNKIDIIDSELATLTLSFMLKNGYFENSFEYLRLSKNEYDEYCLFHLELNNVNGLVNNTAKNEVFLMNKNDNDLSSNTPEVEDFIYSKSEVDYLSKLRNILIISNDFKELITNFNNLNKENFENVFNFKKINEIFKLNDSLNIIKIMNLFLNEVNEEEETEIVKRLKIKDYKIEVNQYNFYAFEQTKIGGTIFKDFIKEAKKSKEDAINYCLGREIIPSNYNDLRKKDFLYNESILKIIDNCDFSNNIDILNNFLDDKFNSLKSLMIMKIEEIINNECELQIYNKYKKEIDAVSNVIYKKYPNLKENFHDVDFKVWDIENLNKSKVKELLKDSTFLEMYDHKRTKNKTAVINGLNSFEYYNSRNQFEEHEFYLKISNEFEIVSIFDIRMKNLGKLNDYKNSFENIKEIKIFGIDYLFKKDFNMDIIKAAMTKVVNLVDNNTVLTYEFADANSIPESDKIILKNMFNEILKDNNKILKIDLHRDLGGEGIYNKKLIKYEALNYLENGLKKYEDLIPVFQKIENMKKEEFENLTFIDKEIKIKKIVKNLFEEAKINKIKNKV